MDKLGLVRRALTEIKLNLNLGMQATLCKIKVLVKQTEPMARIGITSMLGKVIVLLETS